MMNETMCTLTGNLTADPELGFTPSGAAVANFTVAATSRTFDKTTNQWRDGEALFLRCTLWRQPAENLAESLHRGDRVIVTGRLRQRSFDTREGDKRTMIELDVDEIGASLRPVWPVLSLLVGGRYRQSSAIFNVRGGRGTSLCRY
ncbi:MAG TPA: single-stranded DNA-binding protein [Pseudonocardiaceae bacterium]|nr:single-stranded DNA-binding protein [Pseudonocardiaceae bacterium]